MKHRHTGAITISSTAESYTNHHSKTYMNNGILRYSTDDYIWPCHIILLTITYFSRY